MVDKDQNIKILSDREHILLRPGVYAGSTKPEKQIFWVVKDNKLVREELTYIPAAYKIFNEIIDNALDEHCRGYGNEINVVYDRDSGFYTIQDHARGIPLEIHKDAKVYTPEVVFCQLRAGSNFESEDTRVTVGMNGMGACLATVFSEKLIVQVRRDNKLYQQTYSNNMEKIGKPLISEEKSSKTGTLVKFKPDPKIFSIAIPEVLLHKRCMELSVMYPKLKITLKIESKADDECLGCSEPVVYESKNFEDFLKLFDSQYSLYEDNKAGMKMAIVRNKHSESFEHLSNINGADTFRGGTHVDSVKEIFTEDFKDKIKKETKLDVTSLDVSKNMIVVLFQIWKTPMFEGQTKEKFVNDKLEVKKVYDDLFSSRKLTSMISELGDLKQAIIDDVTLKLERKDLKDLKDLQKNISRKKIAKLIDCSAKDREKCSIYITEGDSAISTLATVRDSKYMAGLPLRGKVMNVHEVTAKTVVENKEIASIMSALNLKIGESPLVVNQFGKVQKNNLSYGKIIIATDQDMDGYSIRCLLINLLFKFWPEIVEHGCVYILETPLYEVIDKKSSEIHYFYNKADYETFINDKNTFKYDISYFKGLGSCGREAWDYMINKNPNLVKITVDNKKLASDKLKMVFGDDSEGRKEWLSN